jgi:cytoskeletal protein RodZ
MADIGSTLREARMRARIDITEVEARTKIRAKYLRALENEGWEALPGPIYTKSFLKTYGDYLGLDSRLLVDDFKRRYERPSDNEMRPISTLSRERERAAKRAARGPLIPSWAIIAAVLVVVVVALYALGSSNKKPAPSPTGLRGQTTTRHHATVRPTRPPAPPKPTTVKLELVPTGKVYICLVDGTGRKLIPGVIYNAGQTIPAEASSKLLLTLGNAAVQMKVNGASVKVAPSPTSIGYEFTPTKTSVLPAAQQPRCA